MYIDLERESGRRSCFYESFFGAHQRVATFTEFKDGYANARGYKYDYTRVTNDGAETPRRAVDRESTGIAKSRPPFSFLSNFPRDKSYRD